MEAVNSFINILGKNYYLDFLLDPNSEEVDYNEHFVMVYYQDKKYYEQPFDYIKIRQNEIIKDCKISYENSLSEIFLEVSKKSNDEIDKFLNFNIEAIKVKLNTLKNDFYIDSKSSRYCSLLYDNFDTQELDSLIIKRDYDNNDSEINEEFREVLNRIDSSNDFNSRYYIGSQYFFELLYYRSIQLSILPFMLFGIGNKLIINLNKIKELNSSEKINKEQLKSGKTKKDTYFVEFCNIIDDCNILSKSTAIGVMIDLQQCIKEIKSETLLELQENGVNRNDHLDFKINEVEKRSYIKEADITYIKKWINEYQIGLTDILNNSLQGNPLEYVINAHYKDMEKFSPEKDKAYNAQLDFYQYFCRYYADELIAYFKSKMTINENIIIETENTNQLSVNQAIILLDKLGVFTDKVLDNVSNVKKAKLISQLLGKNEKNIKTAIEKLELKPSEIKPNYQKDLDKIQQLLNNLE